MLRLLRLLKNYKKECIFGPLIKLIEVVFELTVPLVVAKIIDNGITAGDKPYILKMCGAFCGRRAFVRSSGAVFFGKGGGGLCDRYSQ